MTNKIKTTRSLTCWCGNGNDILQTKEDIIRMAEEAGFETCNGDGWPNEWLLSNIEKFANLIAAHERDACAKACDEGYACKGYATGYAAGYENGYSEGRTAGFDLGVGQIEINVKAEREAIIQTIDELTDDRHPMFAQGYDYALRHIREFIECMGQETNPHDQKDSKGTR
jgi:hypothetical protein